MVLSNPDDGVGSGLEGWSAADVNESESLEEMAIVKRLRRFCVFENSHAGYVSTGHAIERLRAIQRVRIFSNTIQTPENKGEKRRLLFEDNFCNHQ